MFLVENPYESPRSIDSELNGPSAPKNSFLRGGVWAVVWGGAAFFIAPLAAAIASTPLIGDWNQQGFSEIWAQFKKLSGIGVFFGLLFSLAALGNYTPTLRVGFIRTLLQMLLVFFISSFLVLRQTQIFG